MFLQIPTPPAGAIENWLIPAAAIGSIFLLFKKVFQRKPDPPNPELVTRAELHRDLDGVRDRIDARSLALGEKIEALGTSIHTRLNQLESAVARVDERTKL